MIENLLKYQKLDGELYRVEQKMTNGEYKKKATELSTVAKKAQAKSGDLEAEAAKLIAEIDDIKQKYNINKSKLDEMLAKEVEEMSLEDVDKVNSLKGKILSNLNILEKMLQKAAESINKILSEFNKTKKLFDEARNQYAICKQKIDEEIAVLNPQKEKLQKDLQVLEKDVAAEIMAEYKKKRNDRIFPVIVPLENGAFCGHCRMEQPKAAIAKLKELDVITCEHCKRFIYNKK